MITHVSPNYKRHCKHGHLRTEETTFPRKCRVNGKLYIVRECRICHSMRNNPAAPWRRGQSNSKWKRFLEERA